MPLLKQCPHCNKIYNIELDCGCKDKIKKEKYLHYKENRKDFLEQRFYLSKEWKKLRDYFKVKYNNLCLMCLYKNIIKSIDEVHHIVEIKEDWDKRLDIDNLIGLCSECHRKVHRAYLKSDSDNKNMKRALIKLKEWYREKFGVD